MNFAKRKGGVIMRKRSQLIQKQVERANDLLGNDRLDQKEKAMVCSMIEGLLMDANCYRGYNNAKWCIGGGSKKWAEDGHPDYDYRNSEYFGPEFDRVYF